MGAEIGLGEDVESPAHLVEEAPVPEAPQMLSWEPVWVEIPWPEHARLAGELEDLALGRGNVGFKVNHAVSKRLHLERHADDS